MEGSSQRPNAAIIFKKPWRMKWNMDGFEVSITAGLHFEPIIPLPVRFSSRGIASREKKGQQIESLRKLSTLSWWLWFSTAKSNFRTFWMFWFHGRLALDHDWKVVGFQMLCHFIYQNVVLSRIGNLSSRRPFTSHYFWLRALNHCQLLMFSMDFLLGTDKNYGWAIYYFVSGPFCPFRERFVLPKSPKRWKLIYFKWL